MKIAGVQTVAFHSRHRNARRNWLLLKLLTDEPGLYGIGEASSLGLDDKVESLLHWWVDNYLKGKDPLDSEVHLTRMLNDVLASHGRLWATAMSGIDIALWDLRGKALGAPVYRLLGGAQTTRLRVYANGWYTNPGAPEQNAEEAKAVVGRGYTALKFDPFGQDNFFHISLKEAQLAEDRVAAVREAVGPEIDILVEAHAKFSAAAAIQLGKRMEKYRPLFYEEPVSYENVSEMAEVRARVDIPIATGERLYTKFPFAQLIEGRAADILQPDICNAGGVTELKKIAAMAEARHLAMAPHNTNSPVGTMASFQLDASLPNFLIQEYHAEYYEPHYFEVVRGLPRQRDGYVQLSDRPGLGLELDEEALGRHPRQALGLGRRRGI